MTESHSMPEGVTLEGPLDEKGRCILDIEVAAAPEGPAHPADLEWFRLRAVISTTFDLINISPAAATRMKLRAHGEVTTDSARRPDYVTSKAPIAFRLRDALGSEFTTPFFATILQTPPGLDAIIGVDQLMLGRLTIDGWNRTWRWVLAGEPGVRTHRTFTNDIGRR